MSEVEWQEKILEYFYLYSPYDSDGKIPYLDLALENIDKITKKAYVYKIYSSIENIDIEFNVTSVKNSLRFKLNVT